MFLFFELTFSSLVATFNTPEWSYYVMAQAVRLSVRPPARKRILVSTTPPTVLMDDLETF